MTVTARTDAAVGDALGRRAGTRYPARVARDGYMPYLTGLERRDMAELFAHETLAGLPGLRVVLGHGDGTGGPTVGRVAPDTSFRREQLSDGHNYLVVDLEIDDEHTRSRIDRGELAEISLGYQCRVDFGDDGHKVQRNLRFSPEKGHVALLAPGGARCGAHCSIQAPTTRKDEMTAPTTPCNCTTTTHEDGVDSATFSALLAARARQTYAHVDEADADDAHTDGAVANEAFSQRMARMARAQFGDAA